MKFRFQKLGLLDDITVELADLTLICGENNTGKTYATYAIYGYLRSWRQLLRGILKDEIKAALKPEGQYQLDLVELFSGKIDHYLNRLGKSYVSVLPRVFASDAETFSETTCNASSTASFDFLQRSYHQRIEAGPNGKVLATIRKEAGSPFLDVLVTDADELKSPFGGLTDFLVEAIAEIVFLPHLPNVHISSAERTGAAIFRKELDMARTRMLKAINEIDSKEILRNPLKLLQRLDADYAWPVEDNVDFVRQLEDLDKRTGRLATERPDVVEAFEELIGGSYRVVKQQLVFQARGAGKQRFTMQEASSSLRALLDVGFYVRCVAKPGDLFMIDEPELNLHPKNQRVFARLVARLVNAGVKVFITTHSDYLVKELNTLIMLNAQTAHTRRVQQLRAYSDNELLDPARVRLYMTAVVTKPAVGAGRRAKIRTLKPATIHPDRGIEVETFDKTIELMNSIQSEILYGSEL
jgi:predicted ATPase